MNKDERPFGGIQYPFNTDKLTLLMSIGAELTLNEIEREHLTLQPLDSIVLSAPIQYVWPHPTRNLLYVATSNRSISPRDDHHTLATVMVDDETGQFHQLAEVALPTRPIHLTVDHRGEHVLVVYNAPAQITLHAIDSQGRAGKPLEIDPVPPAGIFPHQVLMLPSSDHAVIVARGNHAGRQRPEEPGSLELISVQRHRLTHIRTVAPEGGFGFGPRHLAFHPCGKWAAVSLERQNKLYVFPVDQDRILDEPVFKASTVAEHLEGEGIDQLSGTLKFHPGGRYLYVVNRHDPRVYEQGHKPSRHDGNNIAVFEFDENSGRATCIQHIPTESVHVRTLSLDADGQLLVAASILPARTTADGRERHVPARASVFQVRPDGTLALLKTLDQPNKKMSLFWSHLIGYATRK